MQPEPLRCTQYQKLLPLDASHASETLVSVVAVMRRFVGVDGDPPLAAPAVVTSTAVASVTMPAASAVLLKNTAPPL